MNEQTLQLIEKLALKLGTTAEYLWGVLISQAYIHGIINISIVGFFGLFLSIGWYLCLTYKFKEPDPKTVAIGCLICMSILYIGLVLPKINDIITSFVNPEYWALKQIIK